MLFRATLGFGEARWRLAGAVAAAATIPVGLLVAPAAQVATVAVVVAAALTAEYLVGEGRRFRTRTGRNLA